MRQSCGQLEKNSGILYMYVGMTGIMWHDSINGLIKLSPKLFTLFLNLPKRNCFNGTKAPSMGTNQW